MVLYVWILSLEPYNWIGRAGLLQTSIVIFAVMGALNGVRCLFLVAGTYGNGEIRRFLMVSFMFLLIPAKSLLMQPKNGLLLILVA